MFRLSVCALACTIIPSFLFAAPPKVTKKISKSQLSRLAGAFPRLSCEVSGTPTEFPDDLYIKNTGKVVIKSGQRLSWFVNPKLKGIYQLAKNLKPNEGVSVQNVIAGGMEAGTKCKVSLVKNTKARKAAKAVKTNTNQTKAKNQARALSRRRAVKMATRPNPVRATNKTKVVNKARKAPKARDARRAKLSQVSKLVPRFSCTVSGTPVEFPNDLYFENTGSILVKKGQVLTWNLDGKKGQYKIIKDLKPGQGIRANDVLSNGVEAGKKCQVSLSKAIKTNKATRKAFRNTRRQFQRTK